MDAAAGKEATGYTTPCAPGPQAGLRGRAAGGSSPGWGQEPWSSQQPLSHTQPLRRHQESVVLTWPRGSRTSRSCLFNPNSKAFLTCPTALSPLSLPAGHSPVTSPAQSSVPRVQLDGIFLRHTLAPRLAPVYPTARHRGHGDPGPAQMLSTRPGRQRAEISWQRSQCRPQCPSVHAHLHVLRQPRAGGPRTGTHTHAHVYMAMHTFSHPRRRTQTHMRA